jgi:hypothetical protein
VYAWQTSVMLGQMARDPTDRPDDARGFCTQQRRHDLCVRLRFESRFCTSCLFALSFVMVLCLLVYRLAEHLLRRQLVATQQTIPNQVNKPTNRPTMRWIFQCFECIDLLHLRIGSGAANSPSTGSLPAWSCVFRLLFFLSVNCGRWSPATS